MKWAIYQQAFVVLLVNCSQFVTCSCPKLHILFASISYFTTKTSQKNAQAALHNFLQVSWKVKFCLSVLSVVFLSWGNCQMSPEMTCLKSQWSYFVRELEVVYKQVGIYLISYNLQLACVRKLEVIWPDMLQCRVDRIEWSLTQWKVGIELLAWDR